MKLRTLGTHDGSFHADEVTAAALLLVFNRIDRHQIIRSRDLKELDECEYVCDVGGLYDPFRKRFDHHQLGYQGELSSAGMVLLYLFEQGTIDQKKFNFLRQSLVWNPLIRTSCGHMVGSRQHVSWGAIAIGPAQTLGDWLHFCQLPEAVQ